MQRRFHFAASIAAIAVYGFSSAAFAQSTGSVDFEEEIIVTGARADTGVAGAVNPDSTKAKAVLTQEFLSKQGAGQSVLDSINTIPGVNFQNNDAYGSSGGTLNIRGFSSDRISLTFDGIPLNDSGNYAIFSNQQITPELIDNVNVNLGATDVDSPTAAAVGGTVNLRTLTPSHDFGLLGSGTIGDFKMGRGFAKIESGDLTSGGLRMWVAGEYVKYRNPFNNYGKMSKKQLNAKIYQPIGSDGDFVSLAGHYNQNRNNFFGSLPLRWDASPTRIVGPNSANRFPMNSGERKYNINFPCTVDVAQPGVADTPAPAPANQASCGTEFDRRYNPSNTGNFRMASKFTLAQGLTFTFEPSYQFVKANGGGTVTAREGFRDIDPTAVVNNQSGYLGGNPFFGRDINGDGDILDQVNVIAPSHTNTKRIGVIANLKYELNEQNTIRLSYTLDRARHRQTGEVGLLQTNGEPFDVFPVNSGQADNTGKILQKRDRLSYAILNQVSAEYTGKFMDENLVVNLGARLPFFKRDLNQNCFTSSAAGFVECFGKDAGREAIAATANPYVVNSTTGIPTGWAAPQQRIYNYKKFLPNLGLRYKFTPDVSVFASFAKGLQVPGTDPLYNSIFFPSANAKTKPLPETTDSYELGMRVKSRGIEAQASGWMTQYQNRLASAYDADLDTNVYRNLGNVKKWGLDASLGGKVTSMLEARLFLSVNNSKIKDNVAIGENTDGTPIYALTAGKRESGSPNASFGGEFNFDMGAIEFNLNAKRTGRRAIYDTGDAIFTGAFVPFGAKTSTNGTPASPAAPTQIFGAYAPAYWLLNASARLHLESLGMGFNDKSFLQLNVYNLADQFYVGGFGGGLVQANTFSKTTGQSTYGATPFVQIGAPRTVSLTASFGF